MKGKSRVEEGTLFVLFVRERANGVKSYDADIAHAPLDVYDMEPPSIPYCLFLFPFLFI